MNERIKELAEQCRIETYGANGELLEFGFDEGKFAELIVRECADIVLNGRAKEDEPWDHSFWNQACENRAYAIKEHFGVKE